MQHKKKLFLFRDLDLYRKLSKTKFKPKAVLVVLPINAKCFSMTVP